MASHKQRQAWGRIGAQVMLSRNDPRVTSEKGRRAFLASFEAQVDPDGVLEPEERARRARAAHKAHMLQLAQKSAAARRARKRDRADR